MKKHIGIVCLLAAALLWGALGYFVRGLNAYGFSTIQVVSLRFITASLSTAAAALVIDRKAFRIRPKDIWMFLGTGVASIFAFNYCYLSCMTLTSLTLAVTFTYTAPAFAIALAAILFKERITPKVIIGMVLAVAGSLIAMGIWNAELRLTPLGTVLGLSFGLFFALYSIFSRLALKRYSSLTITLYSFIFAAIAATAVCSPVEMVSIMHDAGFVPNLLGLGILCTPIPYFLYTYGVSKVKVSVASIITLAEIVTATLISALVYHEELRLYQIIGVLLVVGAVILLAFGNTNADSPKKEEPIKQG